MSWEKIMTELDKIVVELESSDTTLENGIKLYEKGILLTGQALEILKESKGKISILESNLNKLTEKGFSVDDD